MTASTPSTPPSTDRWSPRAGEAIDLLALGEGAETIRCAPAPVAHEVRGRRADDPARRPARLLVRPGLSAVRPVPGELFTVEVGRCRRIGGSWVIQGSLVDPRLDPVALGIERLGLRLVPGRAGEWELERSVGSLREGRPRAAAARTGVPASASTLAGGAFRLGTDPTMAPLEEIEALWEAGDLDLALHLAGDLLAHDLRCIEAHALLGSFFLDGPLERRWSERALRHFRVGTAIGRLGLGDGFDGRLPWRLPGNRGFLRCLAGEGRARARLGDAAGAARERELLTALAPEAAGSL